MGLIVSIYKDKGREWSNGGVSSRVDELTLVNVDGPFEPTEDRPAALLVPNAMGTVRVVPAIEVAPGGSYVEQGAEDALGAPGVGPMMGGCYVATSDSRFSEKIEALLGGRFYGAVPLHDRFESWATYEALSR